MNVVGRFIAVDLLPLSEVEGSGFCNLMKLAQLRFLSHQGDIILFFRN